MKMKFLNKAGIALISVLLFNSCGNQSKPNVEDQSKTVSVDSLVNSWSNAWNQKDKITLTNMLNNNTVYIFGGRTAIGIDSINKYWLDRNLNEALNIKTTKVSEGANADIAYYAGTWVVDETRNDSIIGKREGTMSVIWKKQNDKSWKMEVVHFGWINK
jgi:ketosteroid isomerase-like protein